jgi:hypothetical protein
MKTRPDAGRGDAAAPSSTAEAPPGMDELLRIIARQRATAGPAERAGGSTLYRIPAGWESLIMARDPSVRRVTTSFQLEDAFTDPDVATILVPRGAVLTFTVVRRVCARHGMGKTVFFEGDKNEQS